MKKMGDCLRLCLLLSLVGLWTACADDDYHYPSVSLEFMTASTNSNGYLQTVQADDGTVYEVMNAVAAPHLAADSTLRIVANYAREPLDDGSTGALLYEAQTAISPVPCAPDAFAEGVKADPASVLSIWMGLDYLNLVLEIQCADGAHAFHFVEERIDDLAPGRREVSLSLYHDAGDDPAYYTRRVYLSVPLRQYAADGGSSTIRFSLRNYAGETETYTFDYSPALSLNNPL